jgi:hypothetical protein
MQHVLAVLAFLCVLSVSAQIKLPSTFPHDYPGETSSRSREKNARSLTRTRQTIRGSRSRVAAVYDPLVSFKAPSKLTLLTDYQVTEPLPNVSFPLPRHFAGNVPVNRPDHPNCTLFFWGFERTNGSLSAAAGASQEPWMVWLNGGCALFSLETMFSVEANGAMPLLDRAHRACMACSSRMGQ